MFYLHIDPALPVLPNTADGLFAQYAAQNIHPGMAPAYAAPTPTGAFHFTASSATALAMDTGMVLQANEWVSPGTFSGCSMVMSAAPGGVDTYVYHAGAGYLPADEPGLQTRADDHLIVMATPEFCAPGEVLANTPYFQAVGFLLAMGYAPNRICLIDGVNRNHLIYMKGDGTIGGG